MLLYTYNGTIKIIFIWGGGGGGGGGGILAGIVLKNKKRYLNYFNFTHINPCLLLQQTTGNSFNA